MRNRLRRFKKGMRFNERMAIRNLMDTYEEEPNLCRRCGIRLDLAFKDSCNSKFTCPLGYEDVDCWD